MIRVIAGVVVGYVAMVAMVIGSLLGVWAVLGPEGAFQSGSNVASIGWSLGGLITGFIAAVVGGVIAALVAGPRASGAVKGLVGVVLVLGIAGAISNAVMPQRKVEVVKTETWTNMTLEERVTVDEGGVMTVRLPEDPAAMSFFEAGAVAQSPVWYNFVIPIVGAVGVILGAKLVRRPHAAPSPADA